MSACVSQTTCWIDMKSVLVTRAVNFIGYEVVRRSTSLTIPTHVLVRPTSDTSRLEMTPYPPQVHVINRPGFR